VFLYPDLKDDLWVLVLEGPPADFAIEDYPFGYENPIYGTSEVEELLKAWSVDWFSGSIEEILEERVFDIRATLVNSDSAPARECWYGQ